MSWRFGLGLRLGPRPSAEHVPGWYISDSRSESIAIESRSALVDTSNVVVVGDSNVMWVTFVRYDRRVGRLMWAMAVPIHHLAVRNGHAGPTPARSCDQRFLSEDRSHCQDL